MRHERAQTKPERTPWDSLSLMAVNNTKRLWQEGSNITEAVSSLKCVDGWKVWGHRQFCHVPSVCLSVLSVCLPVMFYLSVCRYCLGFMENRKCRHIYWNCPASGFLNTSNPVLTLTEHYKFHVLSTDCSHEVRKTALLSQYSRPPLVFLIKGHCVF